MAVGTGARRAPEGGGVERRPAVDVARILALGAVVAGHLLLAVVDRDADGEVRAANLLALEPGWAWVAVIAPMPVFFAAGGWANAHATLRSSAARLGSLVGVAAVVVAAWSVPVVVVGSVTGDADLVADGARVATQPLWFLAAYIPLAAAGGQLARLAHRAAWPAVAAALVTLAVIDVGAASEVVPAPVQWIAFALAWATPWLVGAWWRDRSVAGPFAERRVGWALVVGGAVVAVALVRWAGYSASLIDTGDGGRSNTTPPGLYTAVVGIAQVGVLLVASPALDRLGRRNRAVWDRAGTAAVGVYVWHLSALALCVGVLALGVPVPTRLSGWWWASRLLWWATVVGVTGSLVALNATVQARLAARSRKAGRTRPPATRVRSLVGVVVAATGAGVVGLVGPTDPAVAAVCTTLFVAGWWLLRVAPAPAPRDASSGRTTAAGAA